MTKHDLETAGILVDGKISDQNMASLILRYNKHFINGEELDKFNKFSSVIDQKFSGNKNNGEYLKNCLAICCKPLQESYLREKENEDRLIAIHYAVANKSAQEIDEGKENIRKARTLAEEADAMSVKSRKYNEKKDQYDYLHACVTEEDVFDRFYKNLEGRIEKDQARQMLHVKFAEIEQRFLESQSRYFDFFINYQIKEDARVIAKAEQKLG